MARKQFFNICISLPPPCAQFCVAEKSHFRRQQLPGDQDTIFWHVSFAIMWFLCSVVEVGGTQMHVNLPIPTCQKQLSSNAVPFPSRTHSAYHGHIFCNTKNRSGKYS